MIRAILYNISAFIILTLFYVGAFVAGRNFQTFPSFLILAIFLLITAFIVFLFINVATFKKHKWWLRLLLSSFLSFVFTVLWELAASFAAIIACKYLEIPFQSYIKEVEPLTVFLLNIDNSPISGLIFSLLFLTFVFCWWYWVLFKNGATTWSADIIEYNKKLGFAGNNFMAHPVLLKISSSIMLAGGFFAVYAALMSLIKKI